MCAVRREDISYSQDICTTEFSEAKEARKSFDDYSMEGFDRKSIEGMQPKKRRTRINYCGACTPRRWMGLRSADSENK